MRLGSIKIAVFLLATCSGLVRSSTTYSRALWPYETTTWPSETTTWLWETTTDQERVDEITTIIPEDGDETTIDPEVTTILPRSGGKQCVLLSECPPLLWLLQHRDDQPNLDRSQVMKRYGQMLVNPQLTILDCFFQVMNILADHHCGFEGVDPRVLCEMPDEDDFGDEDGGEDYDDEGLIARDGFTENLSRAGCVGSLTIYHSEKKVAFTGEVEEENETLETLKVLKLKGAKYYNLSKRHLRSRKVHEIQVDGNCCWMIYSKPKFLGRGQILEPGFARSPDHHPTSIKRGCF